MLVTPSAANAWINIPTLSSITGSLVVTNTTADISSKIERDRMATNTIADIHPVEDSWVEMFTATGIVSGSDVILLNKGSVGVLVYLSTSNNPPSISTTDGWAVGPQESIKISAESYVFLKALGPIADVHVETA